MIGEAQRVPLRLRLKDQRQGDLGEIQTEIEHARTADGGTETGEARGSRPRGNRDRLRRDRERRIRNSQENGILSLWRDANAGWSQGEIGDRHGELNFVLTIGDVPASDGGRGHGGGRPARGGHKRHGVGLASLKGRSEEPHFFPRIRHVWPHRGKGRWWFFTPTPGVHQRRRAE